MRRWQNMSKTIKLSDTDYQELSRIKRELEHTHNRNMTLGFVVGIMIGFYRETVRALSCAGPEHPIHEDPDDSN